MNVMEIINILSGVLTPLTAIFAIYIAVKQHRIEKKQYELAKYNTRRELYERRLPIYKAVSQYVGMIVASANIKDEDLVNFLRGTAERNFLFDKDIEDYIDELYKKGVDLRYFESMIKAHEEGKKEDRDKFHDKKFERIEYFSKQFDIMDKKFGKYLSMKN